MNKQDVINIILAVVSLVALYIAFTRCNRDNFSPCSGDGCSSGMYTGGGSPPNSAGTSIAVPLQTVQNTVVSVDSASNFTTITTYDAPIGSIVMWPSTDATSLPTGWLFCDGSTYVSNSITYTLPNLCGRFVVGAGNGNNKTASYNIGDIGGEEVHQLTESENGPHNHGTDYGSSPCDSQPCPAYGFTYNDYAKPALATNSSGLGEGHNTLPPYCALAYIIKVSNGPLSGTVTGNGMNNSQ